MATKDFYTYSWDDRMNLFSWRDYTYVSVFGNHRTSVINFQKWMVDAYDYYEKVGQSKPGSYYLEINYKNYKLIRVSFDNYGSYFYVNTSVPNYKNLTDFIRYNFLGDDRKRIWHESTPGAWAKAHADGNTNFKTVFTENGDYLDNIRPLPINPYISNKSY